MSDVNILPRQRLDNGRLPRPRQPDHGDKLNRQPTPSARLRDAT